MLESDPLMVARCTRRNGHTLVYQAVASATGGQKFGGTRTALAHCEALVGTVPGPARASGSFGGLWPALVGLYAPCEARNAATADGRERWWRVNLCSLYPATLWREGVLGASMPSHTGGRKGLLVLRKIHPPGVLPTSHCCSAGWCVDRVLSSLVAVWTALRRAAFSVWRFNVGRRT